MKYEAIEGRKQDFPVARMCAVLQVAESGYYAWLSRAPSRREQENVVLSDQIKQEAPHALALKHPAGSLGRLPGAE